MDIESFREYCLSKPYATEDMPFDEASLCFKVGLKIFAILDISAGTSVILKCNPDRSVELRSNYNGIIPGWHMNKKHWNTVYLDTDVNVILIKELVDHSYDLVYDGLSQKIKNSLISIRL